MNKLRQLWKRLFAFISLLITTSGLISSILTVLTFLGLGSVIYGFIGRLLPVIFIGSIYFILSCILLISLYTFLQGVKKEEAQVLSDISIYPSPPPETFEIVLKKLVYQYYPDGKTIIFRRRNKLRALQNGITHHTDRYKWTSTGTCILKSLTPSFTLTNERKEEFWEYYDVKFPYPLQKDMEVDYTIQWDLFDEEQNAVPFLSSMIDAETQYLSMSVILPPELAPKCVYCHEFADYIDTLPIKTEEVHWDQATQTIAYDVPSPKKYHKYLIRWYN